MKYEYLITPMEDGKLVAEHLQQEALYWGMLAENLTFKGFDIYFTCKGGSAQLEKFEEGVRDLGCRNLSRCK